MNKELIDILSNTTDIHEVQRTIRTFTDDQGRPFLTIFYDEDMLTTGMEIYPKSMDGVYQVKEEDMQEVLDLVIQRQKEL